MPRVKIDYIVSFSSEDPENPASNLLAWDVNKKKWLCNKGEPSCSVVLQLSKAVKICSVNIGAYQSALVEVLVGRSETPNEPFQVLVPSSVFQTPSEARRAAPPDADKVRSFGAESLATARTQRWDRLRLVCTQPYNKHCKFGLSFVHVYSEDAAPVPDAPAPTPVPVRRPAPLDLQSSDEEEFRPGELFAKHLQKPIDTPNTGAQIRQATSHALKNIPDSSTKLTKAPIAKPSTSKQRASLSSERETDRQRDREAGLLYTADDDRPNDKVDRAINRHNEQKRDEQTNKQQDIHNKNDRTLDKHASTSKTHHEPSHKGDRPMKKDDRNFRNGKKNDDPSRNGRKDDGHSINKRKDGGPSNDRRKDNDPPSDRRKEDGPSSDKRKNDGTSSNRRKEYGPSTDRKKDDDPTSDKRKEDDPSSDKRKNDGPSGDTRNEDESRKRRHSDKKHDKAGSLSAGPVSSAPHTLLSDVVFVLSGYENPRRAALRTAALALGAACRRDWGPGCTHLICAFSNTPKLRLVRAGAQGARAVAVRGEWVEETARARRRLPWQWFATEDPRRVSPPPAWDAHSADTAAPPPEEPHSECDTDDEIERVRQKMKKRRTAPASASSDVMFVRDERLQGSVIVVESDSCGGSTDEEGGGAQSPAAPEDCLPALFAGRVFAIHASESRAALLRRYLQAYGGLVTQQEADSEVDYVVCDTGRAGEGQGSGGGAGGAVRVRAAWVWRCHEARQLCPADDYLLTPT